MENVVVLEWAAKIGDAVKVGDLLVTVETAKAATEIEAVANGFLTAIFAEPGTEVRLSAELGLIGETVLDVARDAGPKPAAQPKSEAMRAPAIPTIARVIASPAARLEAKVRGIDLTRLVASSPTGRIKLRDLATTQTEAASALPIDERGALKIYRSGTASGTPILLLH
jgi:pyruvate/2-oxoglutarate dehydrogenase complex dihydrolipoamide acyltransferase (E2) component